MEYDTKLFKRNRAGFQAIIKKSIDSGSWHFKRSFSGKNSPRMKDDHERPCDEWKFEPEVLRIQIEIHKNQQGVDNQIGNQMIIESPMIFNRQRKNTECVK